MLQLIKWFMPIALCLVLLACQSAPQQNNQIQSMTADTLSVYTSVSNAYADFQQHYTGYIRHDLPVYFQLTSKEGLLTGTYCYLDKGIDILLTGRVDGTHILLYEEDCDHNQLAVIDAVFTESGMAGTWKHIKTGVSYTLELTPTSQLIPLLPEPVAGVFVNSADTDCPLTLTITCTHDGYTYLLKTPTRQLKGTITFSRLPGDEDIYINLEGIRWAEYAGALDEDGNPVHEHNDLPVGISGYYTHGEILIQNYGNSMNYYTKLGECGNDKYIRLLRKK